MSTTFGIKIKEQEEPIEVAHRSSSKLNPTGLEIRILNPLVLLLPNETPLIAMDNSNQGIDTVGDLKYLIICNKETP